MQRLLATIAVTASLLSATSLLQAQDKPATEPNYVLRFKLSETTTMKFVVHESDKFHSSLNIEGVDWKIEGTSSKKDEKLGLDIDIISEQGDEHNRASSHIHSAFTLTPDGKPVTLGTVSTSIDGGTPQTHEITIAANKMN